MNEEYVKIKDYPYYISNMGNVKNKTGSKYSDSLGRCKIRDYRYCESGKGHGRSCRIICKKGDNIQIFESINIAGMKLGISHQNICKCLKGERETAKGYSFRRA